MNDLSATCKPRRSYWSHRAWLHRFLVKAWNACMTMVPFSVKYSMGRVLRKRQYPYRLLRKGMTVVQIGAPSDTLRAGRSRAMYFALLNKDGRTLIIEPAEASETAFNAIAKDQGLKNLVFHRSGVWDKKQMLKIYYDPLHPATSFTEGTVDYPQERIAQFHTFNVPCDTLDGILDGLGVDRVDLLSITANGAEVEILKGAERTIRGRGVDYLSLVLHEHRPELGAMMDQLGYEPLAQDDRGVTFSRRAGSGRSAVAEKSVELPR